MASLQGTLFETHAIRAVYYVKVSPTNKGQSVGPKSFWFGVSNINDGNSDRNKDSIFSRKVVFQNLEG